MREWCCVKMEFPPGRITIDPQRAINIATTTIVSHSISISGLQIDHSGNMFCWSNKSAVMAFIFLFIPE